MEGWCSGGVSLIPSGASLDRGVGGVTSLRSLKERNHHQAVNRGKLFMEIKNVLVLFELAGEGFFFFFVVIENGFDMFCNIVQVMLENTFT